MAYNNYYDIEKIVGLKGAYDEAKKRNDQKAMNDAANGAQAYYDNLIKNNYGDIANQLKNSGYTEAQKIKTATGTKGKTAIRPYFYNMGKQYGMSQSDIDKALGFNNATGEVTLGGKNIGTPYANVDGTTYWEADKLKNIWDDYTSSMGISKTPEVRYNQGMENIQKKLDGTYDLTNKDHDNVNNEYKRFLDYSYSNPYETEIADSIMEDFKWKGAKASNEAIASGGGSNGGNIDSYSAANASRQQKAFTEAGKAAVREDFISRLNNINNALISLGNYNQGIYDTQHQNIQLDMQNNQREYDNLRTDRLDKFNQEAQIAEITGYVPQSWSYSQNPFLNDDGSVKNPDGIDFQEIINNAQAEYERTGNTAWLKTIEDANEARNRKIYGDFDKYGQYASTMRSYAPQTAAQKNTDADRYVTWQMNKDNNYTSRYNTDSTNNASMHNSDNALALGKHQSDNNLAGIMDTNATNRYTTDAGFDFQKWLGENGYLTYSSSKPRLSFNEAKSLYDEGVVTEDVLNALNYYAGITPQNMESANSSEAANPDEIEKRNQEYKDLYNNVVKYGKGYGYKNISDIPKDTVKPYVLTQNISDETKAKFLYDLGINLSSSDASQSAATPNTASADTQNTAVQSSSSKPYGNYGMVFNDITSTALANGYKGADKNPKSIPKTIIKKVAAKYSLSDEVKADIESYFDVKLSSESK